MKIPAFDEMKGIKLNERIAGYLIEGLFVLISVFLAFWLNEVREQRGPAAV